MAKTVRKRKAPRAKHMSCCGTRELVGVSRYRPIDLVRALTFSGRFAHVFFTDTHWSEENTVRSGWKMEEFIKVNNLGNVIKSETRINPNSGNKLTAWIWTVSRAGLERWKKENLRNGA